MHNNHMARIVLELHSNRTNPTLRPGVNVEKHFFPPAAMFR